MSERPILFRDDMCAAILDGRKTVTRRVGPTWARVQPGTRLWVREAWRPDELATGVDGVTFRADGLFRPIEDTREAAGRWVAVYRRGDARWRPSIHMPRWASRLTLEVVSVEPESMTLDLGFMTEDEARREGFKSRAAFVEAWWKMHPNHMGVVYRIEFRRVTP